MFFARVACLASVLLCGHGLTFAVEPYLSIDERAASPGETSYFINPQSGDDQASGLEKGEAWRSFDPLNRLRLSPGDRVEILAPGKLDRTLLLSGAGTAEKPIRVNFAPGCYDFDPAAAYREAYQMSNTNGVPDGLKAVGILLKQAKYFEVSGAGAVWIYRGKTLEVCLDHAEDVMIRGLAFDYHRPTVSEFRVKALGESYADLAVHKDSTYQIKDGVIHWTGEGWSKTEGLAQELDPETGFVHRRGGVLRGVRCEEIEPFVIRAHGNHNLKEGHIYQIRETLRDCAGVFVRRSRNITWKDVHFRFIHGMGMVNQFSENLTFDGVKIAPDPASGRTTAAWADGIQVSGCKGKVLVKNCEFSGMHDDPINVHGTHLKVVERLGGNQIKVEFMHQQTFGFLAFNPGDEVDFVRKRTLATYGTNRVKEARMISPKEILLALENPVSDEFEMGDVLENVTWTPEVEIRGCKVSVVSTRGFLITTRRLVLVEDNEFHGTHMSAILVDNDASGWHESGCVRDMTIRGNRFIRCNSPVIHVNPRNSESNPAVHRNIRVLENEFVMRGNTLVHARSVTGLKVVGNTVDQLLKPEDAVVTVDCADVVIEGNSQVSGE
jgi:hypothetical protein